MTYPSSIQDPSTPIYPIEEQALELVTTASPPRVSSPESYISAEQEQLQNRDAYIDNAIELFEAFVPSKSGMSPISEALCAANPTAFEIVSSLLQGLFSNKNQKEVIKMMLQNQVLNIKSLEFFGCEHRQLSEADMVYLNQYLVPPSTRTGHCQRLLNQIAYDPKLSKSLPAGILAVKKVKEILSRTCFEDELDFERHVLKFAKEGGKKQSLSEKFEAYEFIRRMICGVRLVKDNTFSTLDIRRGLSQPILFYFPYVPPELWSLTYLTVLNLSGGALTSLSPQLSELKQLTSLDVSDNALKSLPGELTLLTYLTSLSIAVNKFELFPLLVCQLKQLLVLQCGKNPFQALPPEVGNLTRLENLDINLSNIESFPNQLKMLSHLRDLHYYNNKMTVIPEVMVHFRNLITLEICLSSITVPFTEEVREWLLHLKSNGCNFSGHVPV